MYQQELFQFCNKTLKCDHKCKGVAGEQGCLPCFKTAECIESVSDLASTDSESNSFHGEVEETELCSICYKCELGEKPCV